MKLTGIVYESIVDMYEGRKPMSKDEFIRRAQKIHVDKNGNPKFKYNNVDFDSPDYKGQKSYVQITCPIHGDFPQTVTGHLSGNGCNKCGMGRSSQEDFIKKSIDANRDENGNPKYTYDNVNYVDERTKVMVTCPKHGDFPINPYKHKKGQGCPDCWNERHKWTKDEFINSAKKIHVDEKGSPLYTYNNVDFQDIMTDVIITCPKHGDFPQKPRNHLRGNGCPFCSESKGEKSISKYFSERNVSYDTQKKFDGCFSFGKVAKRCYKLPYDFYLPKLKIAIEIDGGQHFYPVYNNEDFKSRIFNDKLKNKFAENSKDIKKLIRINYERGNTDKLISELEVLLKDKSSNKIVLSKNYPKAGWNK